MDTSISSDALNGILSKLRDAKCDIVALHQIAVGVDVSQAVVDVVHHLRKECSCGFGAATHQLVACYVVRGLVA